MKKVYTTKPSEIIAYWEGRKYEGDMGCDWSEADHRCWRCGHKRSLQRCHIIPNQEPFNGSDTPSNYVLLCKACHAEAPSCPDPEEMWNWIKATRANEYDTFWPDRIAENIKRMYGLDIPDECKKRNLADCAVAYVKILDEEIGLHFDSFSDASRAYVWKRVFALVPVSKGDDETVAGGTPWDIIMEKCAHERAYILRLLKEKFGYLLECS